MDAGCWRASCWLLLTGERGDAADGFWRVLTRSCAVAIAESVEEDVSMTTLVGSQMTVSATSSAVVLNIHMRYHQ
jgi:hypothetical protein